MEASSRLATKLLETVGARIGTTSGSRVIRRGRWTSETRQQPGGGYPVNVPAGNLDGREDAGAARVNVVTPTNGWSTPSTSRPYVPTS